MSNAAHSLPYGNLLVGKEFAFGLFQLMFACHTEFLCFTSFLVCCQGQLPKERNRLSIPVEHQDVILIHDRVIPTAYCLFNKCVSCQLMSKCTSCCCM